MVDLLGMFRRRTAKRSPQGFARAREDITALGDSMGDMLTSPVRDAPPMAREAPPLNGGAAGWNGRPRPKSRVRRGQDRRQARRQDQLQDQWRRGRATIGAARRLSGCA